MEKLSSSAVWDHLGRMSVRADLHPVAGDIISVGLSREIMGATCSNVLSIINSRLSSGYAPDHFKIHPVFSCCSGSAGLESQRHRNLSNFPPQCCSPILSSSLPPIHPPVVPQAIRKKQQKPNFLTPSWTQILDILG